MQGIPHIYISIVQYTTIFDKIKDGKRPNTPGFFSPRLVIFGIINRENQRRINAEQMFDKNENMLYTENIISEEAGIWI